MSRRVYDTRALHFEKGQTEIIAHRAVEIEDVREDDVVGDAERRSEPHTNTLLRTTLTRTVLMVVVASTMKSTLSRTTGSSALSIKTSSSCLSRSFSRSSLRARGWDHLSSVMIPGTSHFTWRRVSARWVETIRHVWEKCFVKQEQGTGRTLTEHDKVVTVPYAV